MSRLFAILIVKAVIAISAFAIAIVISVGLPQPCFSTTDRRESPDPRPLQDPYKAPSGLGGVGQPILRPGVRMGPANALTAVARA